MNWMIGVFEGFEIDLKQKQLLVTGERDDQRTRDLKERKEKMERGEVV